MFDALEKKNCDTLPLQYNYYYWLVVGFMVFNATFNNIAVLLVEETGGPVENHPPAASH